MLPWVGWRWAIYIKKHNKNKIFSRSGPKEDLIFKTTDHGPVSADAVAWCTDVEGDHSPTHFYLRCRNHLLHMDFQGSHRMQQAIPEHSCQACFWIKTGQGDMREELRC